MYSRCELIQYYTYTRRRTYVLLMAITRQTRLENLVVVAAVRPTGNSYNNNTFINSAIKYSRVHYGRDGETVCRRF